MALKHALLGLLAQSPASGWDLQQTFDSSLAQVWPASHSQVYTELNRLASDGSVAVSDEGPRRRKEYTLTAAGHAEWLCWMRDDPNSRPRRSEMLLRVFFLNLVSDQESDGILGRVESGAHAYENELVSLRQELENQEGPLSDNGALALEYGVRLARMQQEWARWARLRNRHASADLGATSEH
jgi:DNA-binding PadR family transcriptional regulator